MGVVADFKTFREPPPGAAPVVRAVSLQVVVNCPCGAPEPIVVHMILGANIKTTCHKCHSEFVMAKLDYSMETGDFSVSVGLVKPTILTPGN